MINNDELLFVVDENDNPLKPLPRSQVIKQGLWRRTGGGMIIDSKSRKVLCQKRSELKDERPGFWTAVFGGKLKAKESAKAGARRELKEELGIIVPASRVHYFKKLKSDARRQMEYIFWVEWSGRLNTVRFEDEEVSEVAWRSIAEIREYFSKQRKGWYSYNYELDLLDWIEKN